MRRQNNYIAAACWGSPVTASPRPGTSRIAALLFVAGALAACGVKGDLERPPAASYAAPAAEGPEQTDTGTAAAPAKVFAEESRVQRVPAFSVLPKMPPEEWEKLKAGDAQPERAPKKSGAPSDPDRPFILDGLL